MGIGFGVDSFHHALQGGSGPHLDKFGGAILEHILYCGGPTHRRGELHEQVALDFSRVAVRQGVDVLVRLKEVFSIASANSTRAGSIRGLWNAPPTASGRALPLASFTSSHTRATPSFEPLMTSWPGQL